MVGKYTIQLSTKRVSFKIDIKRKYTIIHGDSATGKSTIAEYILRHNLQGTDSGVYLKCDIPVKRYTDVESLKSWDNCIVVIDEGDLILKHYDVAGILKRSTCYFIITTRQKLGYLSYSMYEIYELENKTLQATYTETFLRNRYSHTSRQITPELILTEDKNTGFAFFNRTISVECDNAKGKDKIKDKLEECVGKYKSIFVICDGAANGATIGDLKEYIELIKSYCDVYICTPESFEWLLLRSLYYAGSLKQYLDATYDFCDTCYYDSWEQYYTTLLTKLGAQYSKRYSKKIMDEYYYRRVEDVLKLIPELCVKLKQVDYSETNLFDD